MLAAVVRLVLGRLVLRMRAIYLAIATWAFAETVHIFLTAGYELHARRARPQRASRCTATCDPLPYYFTFLGLTVRCCSGDLRR